LSILSVFIVYFLYDFHDDDDDDNNNNNNRPTVNKRKLYLSTHQIYSLKSDVSGKDRLLWVRNSIWAKQANNTLLQLLSFHSLIELDYIGSVKRYKWVTTHRLNWHGLTENGRPEKGGLENTGPKNCIRHMYAINVTYTKPQEEYYKRCWRKWAKMLYSNQLS